MRTGIALGSNAGDRMAHFASAKSGVESLGIGPFLTSRVYETEAVDCAPGTPAFLNAVMEIDYREDLFELLASLQKIEAAAGRPVMHRRYVPRTLDLDILYSGECVIRHELLKVPHPRMHHRRFVLKPLADIRPELVLPCQWERVESLLAKIPLQPQVCLYAECF